MFDTNTLYLQVLEAQKHQARSKYCIMPRNSPYTYDKVITFFYIHGSKLMLRYMHDVCYIFKLSYYYV